MKAIKTVKIGQYVSVPDRIIFPGRRDPYEYENGIVIAFGKNKGGQNILKVRIWNHFTKAAYERWFSFGWVTNVNYYHYQGEEADFISWAQQQRLLPKEEMICILCQ